MSYWRKIRTAGNGKSNARRCLRQEAKDAARRKRRREDKMEAQR